MSQSELDRRAVVNRLKEHLLGPLPDDLRQEIEEALRREHERGRPPSLRKKIGRLLRTL